MEKYVKKIKAKKVKEQVENENVAELLEILRSENFGNEEQRKRMIDVLTSLLMIKDIDARRIFKKLGQFFTDIGGEMLDIPSDDEIMIPDEDIGSEEVFIPDLEIYED